jgi:hypothetical protein
MKGKPHDLTDARLRGARHTSQCAPMEQLDERQSSRPTDARLRELGTLRKVRRWSSAMKRNPHDNHGAAPPGSAAHFAKCADRAVR